MNIDIEAVYFPQENSVSITGSSLSTILLRFKIFQGLMLDLLKTKFSNPNVKKQNRHSKVMFPPAACLS